MLLVASDHLPFVSVRICTVFRKGIGFWGRLGESYDMVIDSVMPVMAYALGHAARRYFEAIPRLGIRSQPRGYREIASSRQEEVAEALRILQSLLLYRKV